MQLPTAQPPWDRLWTNARVVMPGTAPNTLSLLPDAAVAVHGEEIAWVGNSSDLPAGIGEQCPDVHDCQGQLLSAGLIDCHTHLVYASHRAHEFELRLKGASYEEIARAGGGIVSTVEATREASDSELYDQAAPRLQSLIDEGVTRIEIKSGYGLNTSDELKMLRVARQLGDSFPIDVHTSFLGAHALPPEYANRADDYIDDVCRHMLPAAAEQGLADAVDAFCEGIAFSPAQVRRVFETARAHDLPVKLHAEQLSDLKGARLAAEFGALSADHLEYLAEDDIAALASAGTTAVLLPGAFYFLRESTLPPVQALRDHGVPIAVASDSNPGSSPVGSLLLMLNRACTLLRLTPDEALLGVTTNAARALGCEEVSGSVEVGKRADLALWNVRDIAELSYRIGGIRCVKSLYRGVPR